VCRFIFFVLINLSVMAPAFAQDMSSAKVAFPVLGYASGKLLYVPSYRSEHGQIPEQLFAYGGGKEFVGKLRKKDSFIPEPSRERQDCYDDSYKGRFVYEIQQSTGMIQEPEYDAEKKSYEMHTKPATVDVIIFDIRKVIRQEENKWVEESTNTEWQTFHLTSSEGVHDVLRIRQDGKCVGNIDYYTYCDYDTEPDSEAMFREAMCGKKIGESSMGF
jgi:hypothetical protein